ncbi:MAG: M1 family aminopeptidase, partial [Bacteroidota bacterium]
KTYAEDYFRTIDSMLAVFETNFGPYPAEKIGFVFTDSTSVETYTMIQLYRKTMLGKAAYELEGHELAHQWWGNTVTPMDIRENWLSEGFAMYGEWLITAALSRIRTFDGILKQYTEFYRVTEAPAEGALPLYDYMGAGAKYNYTSVIYIKGAIVLNMLRHWMGDEKFRDGMRDYFERNKGKNVSSIMFRDVMQGYTEVSLEKFFDQWVYNGGWPMLTLRQLIPSPSGALQIRVQQRQQDEKGWPLFEMPVDIEVVSHAGDTIRVRRMMHAAQQETFVIDEMQSADVSSWRIDPDGWLLHEAQMITSVESSAASVESPQLESCYPHPLRRGDVQAMQPFSIPHAGVVCLELQDLLGRRLRVVADSWFDTGRHVLPLDLSGIAAGQYRLQLRTSRGVDAHIILVK